MLQRLAFLFCFSVAFWGFSMGNYLISSTVEDATCWRRMGSIGIGFFYGFFKHYVILFSDRKSNLKRKISVLWVYLPSIVFVYLFSISKEISYSVFQLEMSPEGWINTAKPSFWSIVFSVYVVLFFIAGLWRVVQYKKTAIGVVEKNRANALIYFHVIIFLLSIVAGYMNQSGVRKIDFQIAGGMILIVPILYCTKFMGKTLADHSSSESEENIYLEQYRSKIMVYLCQALIVGAITYLISKLVNYGQAVMLEKLYFPALLVGLSLINLVVVKKVKNGEMRTILHSLILFFIIPIITLEFYRSLSITVWAFPLILIIAALLYHDTTVLILLSVSMVLTQCYMWIAIPKQMVQVDEVDYFGRIIIMAFGIGVAAYINYVYIFRLKQLYNKLKDQDLLFEISAMVMSIGSDNLEEQFNKITETIRSYVGANQCHLIIFGKTGREEDFQYFGSKQERGAPNLPYCSDTDEAVIRSENAEIGKSNWFERKFLEEGYAYIEETKNLPLSARLEEQILKKQGVNSLFAIPIQRKGIQTGMLRLDFWYKQMENVTDQLQTLMTVGNLIGEAYGKAVDDDRMKRLAFFDHLTQIPNRQLFDEHIRQSIENAKRQNSSFCVLFLDLDEFKNINDSVGHQIGDQILIQVARKLEKTVRKSDIVSRFGGDEFLIMINHIEAKTDIETVLKKIVGIFEEPIVIEGEEYNLTASIGVSVYPFDGTNQDMLIKNADIAMFRAKRNGKNQYVFCTEEMKEEIAQVMVITNQLYRALEKREFFLVYQPQIDLKSGKIVAVEALLRWTNEELGIVMPSLFIPIAEQIGVITSIGEWVLEEACRQNKIWQDKGLPKLRMAVNVSVIQLGEVDFLKKVKNILEKINLNPEFLELEITENVAMQESEYIIEQLTDIRNLGISLAIDDFGMEYSSLNRIKSFPVDRLKIDMHFIRGLLLNNKDQAIVDVIINLAKNLNLKVIAEGVEEQRQVDYLSEKECDEMQGYYFYKPLTIDVMEKILSEK